MKEIVLRELMNPYGISKLATTQLVKIYRENFDMACYSGILFNHEGPFKVGSS